MLLGQMPSYFFFFVCKCIVYLRKRLGAVMLQTPPTPIGFLGSADIRSQIGLEIQVIWGFWPVSFLIHTLRLEEWTLLLPWCTSDIVYLQYLYKASLKWKKKMGGGGSGSSCWTHFCCSHLKARRIQWIFSLCTLCVGVCIPMCVYVHVWNRVEPS